ncbi:MAG: hypothetical protein ACRYFX_04290 [Janthinobacterium lividum]
MRVSYFLALVALSLLTMSNSCKKEDDVVPCTTPLAVLEAAQIPGFKASITEPVPNLDQSNGYVVNSEAEYRALFAGKKLPPVDFATHTLLAGKTRTATGGTVLAQLVTQTCTGYKYSVKLAPGPAAKAANVVYYVLVPKLPAEAKIEFDVQLPQAAAAQR